MTGALASEVVLLERRRRATMADVDAAQVLYLATPYRWHEELIGDWLFASGRPLSGLFAGGHGFPTVASRAEYHVPVGLDAVLDCRLVAERVGRRSFTLRTDALTVAEGARLAVQVWTTQVWVAMRPGGFEPTELPGWLRDALTAAPALGPAAR